MMTRAKRIAVATAVVTALTAADGMLPGGKLSVGLISPAEARIGRPLTPMSYAGVARRTTRRAVAVGAVAAGAYAATPGCVQVTNAYGQIVTRCN
ncbi:unnamed protein product [marine sediment metagenome]|uniref:Uncharacterized protein n=1 Tax=marine sediment metagenome TaxID=412755 RepID=X1G4T4_9ZZZZ